MKHLIILSIAFISTISVFAQNESVKGEWYTADKEAKIKIYECDNDEICGKVVWLKEPNEEDGSPKKDVNNPDEDKHDNPILGMDLLKGFEKTDDKLWENGTIYDPNNGKTYKCKLTLVEEDLLEVRGFIGFSFLGRTEEWTRAE
ncbi:MAG: DUF2147 domain-containing protein [Chitinophagales bacterium]